MKYAILSNIQFPKGHQNIFSRDNRDNRFLFIMNDFNQVFRIVDKNGLPFTVVSIISERIDICFLNISNLDKEYRELKHLENDGVPSVATKNDICVSCWYS